ncbi:RFX DNA-binding domain-containing protein [Phlyctochytrium arcticum]|nr:RFX DNA-binding domain-containing protein [Phlyctochytrium arcticum]
MAVDLAATLTAAQALAAASDTPLGSHFHHHHHSYTSQHDLEQQQHYEDTGELSGDDVHQGNPTNARETQVPTEADMRRLMLESKDSLEQLAQKAAQQGPQADKARSILVTHWLMENYEQCEGISIPRQNLYDHYCSYCLEHRIDPVNSASFGKLIRTVFPDIKTRRLGTRGKSKYHYCGIRIRSSAAPMLHRQVQAADATAAMVAAAQARSQAQVLSQPSGSTSAAAAGMAGAVGVNGSQSSTAAAAAAAAVAAAGQAGIMIDPSMLRLHQQQLDKALLAKMPELPEIVQAQIPPGMSYPAARALLEAYNKHCQTILQSVQYMKFNEVEGIIKSYWLSLSPSDRELINSPEIVEYVWRYDSLLYDTIMNLLLPNVLQMMPIQIIQAVRQFARQLEGWMLKSLAPYSQLLVSRKIEVAKVFIQQLRRHTSLNHLAQAAAAVLDNQEQVNQMLTDWNRIDFETIRDQASWVCECRKSDIMQIMEIDFRQLLQTGGKLDHWTTWLETVVNRFLDESLDPQRYVYVARQFLLKWAFYSSLAMRDLTLRSATSFGSFHLLRLLFDEYIFYLVEQRIANIKAFEQQTQQQAQAQAQQQQQQVDALHAQTPPSPSALENPQAEANTEVEAAAAAAAVAAATAAQHQQHQQEEWQ